MISAERLSSERERLEQSARPDKRFYAEVMRELEAARTRIAELEAQRRNWLDNDITARTLVAQEREIEQLRAQRLSQEDREALERDAARYRWLRMGGYPMCTVDDEAIDAAIRRLGGQTT